MAVSLEAARLTVRPGHVGAAAGIDYRADPHPRGRPIYLTGLGDAPVKECSRQADGHQAISLR